MSSPPLVSVVAPTYEHPEQVERLLAGLDAQTLPPSGFEVVLADDGSARAPEPGQRAYPVRVVRQEDRGFRAAAARNLGAAAARGEVLAFLDQDVVPAPDYLERVAAATLTPWSLTVGRRRHVDLDGWSGERVRAWLTGTGPAPRSLGDPAWLVDGYARTQDLTAPDDRAYQLVISAVLSLHRDLFARLGGFAESIEGYGGEDWELAHRAYTVGADLRHDDGAVGWHDGPDLAGREEDHRAVKNAETLTLARLVPDRDLRGRGLVWSVPETVVEVRVGAGDAPAALVACAEGLLRDADAGVWFVAAEGDVGAAGVARAAVAGVEDPRVHDGPVPVGVLDRARFLVTAPPVLLRGGSLRSLCAAAPVAGHGVTVRRVRDEHRSRRGVSGPADRPWPVGVEVDPLREEPFLERLWSQVAQVHEIDEEEGPACR